MAFNLSSAGITRCSNVSSNHPTSRPLTFSDSLDLRPDVAVAVNAMQPRLLPRASLMYYIFLAKASAGSATLSVTGTAAIFVELFLKVSYFHYTMMVSTIRLYRLYG